MHIISWNVNGLRAILKKEALQPALDLLPDILCLQETKLADEAPYDLVLPDHPHQLFHFAEKPGYSGTAIFSKEKPLSVTYDLPDTSIEHPLEGRVITAEFEKFFLVNIYVPNSRNDLKRLPYREFSWDPDLKIHLNNLSAIKPTIAVGDFNVAHKDIDIANPWPNRGKAGFTDEERNNFSSLLESGFVDTFRHIHPERKNEYSWWSYRAGARARNVGWRLDYVLASQSALPHLKSAHIYQEVLGSDHCPVAIKADFS